MDAFPNLNTLLPGLCATGTVENAQRLVAGNLTAQSIFEEIEKSKRYDLLSVFLPLLNLECNEERREDFARLYAQEIVNGNEKAVAQLKLHLDKHLNKKDVAFHCGQLTASPLVVEENVYEDYLEGLVSADKLDLLLGTALEPNQLPNLYACAAQYCAQKVMDDFGYTKSTIKLRQWCITQ